MRLIANSLGATYWTVFEVCSRPDLLELVRPICESVVDPIKGEIDSAQLSHTPPLHSVLAEVLRLRVERILMRSTTRPLEIQGCHFPKGAYLIAPSNFGNMNEDMWNTGGPGAPHPLDTFWAERFLIYSDDPSSGLVRRNSSSKPQIDQDDRSGHIARYSEQGLKGAYFPFGGSLHPCPGYQFSQLEVLNTLAILVLDYEIELQVESGWTPRMKTNHYGLGTIPPAEKVPCKIRRKQRS
jgi:cytochrome P450